jgi:hypothetical protein
LWRLAGLTRTATSIPDPQKNQHQDNAQDRSGIDASPEIETLFEWTQSGDEQPRKPSSVTAASETMKRVFKKSSTFNRLSANEASPNSQFEITFAPQCTNKGVVDHRVWQDYVYFTLQRTA